MAQEDNSQIDKRHLRLILPCEDYGILWIKGAHLHDVDFCRSWLESRKYFKGSKFLDVTIDNHGYCGKMLREHCSNPEEWVCEGDYAWFDCPKDAPGATPYTEIGYSLKFDEDELQKAAEVIKEITA